MIIIPSDSDIRMTEILFKIKRIKNIKCWWGWWKTESFIRYWQEFKMLQPRWKIIWQFPIKLNMQILYIPAITHLGIYPREMKTYVYTKTCIQMFMESLFGVAKNWKHKCSSLDEWLKKMCYMNTLEYYSAVKTKRLVIYWTTWICRNNAEWNTHLLKIIYYIITFT